MLTIPPYLSNRSIATSPATIRARTRRRPNLGFSLVELLVVITVVGALISMLLPAIGKAKDEAKLVSERLKTSQSWAPQNQPLD